MGDISAWKVLAVEKALRRWGYSTSAQHKFNFLIEFLRKHGYPPESFNQHGGWLRILANMIPRSYANVGELIEAIRKSHARAA